MTLPGPPVGPMTRTEPFYRLVIGRLRRRDRPFPIPNHPHLPSRRFTAPSTGRRSSPPRQLNDAPYRRPINRQRLSPGQLDRRVVRSTGGGFSAVLF